MSNKGAPQKVGNTSLARAIAASGLPDAEVALLVGSTERTAGAWRRGEYSPRLLLYEKIMQKLAARNTGRQSQETAGQPTPNNN